MKHIQIDCPHCGNVVYATIQWETQVTNVRATLSHSNLNRLTNEQAEYLKRAHRSGLLRAFGEAVEDSIMTGKPTGKNLTRFLFTFARCYRPRTVPGFVLMALGKRYNGFIEIRSANGICAISSEGLIKRFAPIHILSGEGIHNGRSVVGRTDIDHGEFDQWERSLRGHLVGAPKHSIAELTAVSRVVGDKDYFGPCMSCGAYFVTFEELEGHACSAATNKSHAVRLATVQGGLAS